MDERPFLSLCACASHHRFQKYGGLHEERTLAEGFRKGENEDKNHNCGSNFEANMAEIEARLVGMIQAPARKFTQFRMKNFKNRHSFFGKSFLFFFYCVLSRALLHHQETKTSSLSEQVNFRNTLS